MPLVLKVVESPLMNSKPLTLDESGCGYRIGIIPQFRGTRV